ARERSSRRWWCRAARPLPTRRLSLSSDRQSEAAWGGHGRCPAARATASRVAEVVPAWPSGASSRGVVSPFNTKALHVLDASLRLRLPLGISVFDHDVATLYVTQVTQSSTEALCCAGGSGQVRREIAYANDLPRWLRLGRA